MNNSLIIGILQNTALLLALSLVFEYFQANKKYTDNILVKIFTGIILGIIGIILMMTPWTLVPGIVFDTRSVMLSVSGLFFGPIATIIAVLVTGTYRYMLGGDGIYMGIAVILSSGIIGILWGKFFFNINSKRINLNLLFFGIIVHMVMLAWVFLLPKELQWETLSAIALPIIILYPLGTLLLGKLLFKQLLNQKAKSDLKESENKFKTLFQSMNEGFALHELIFDENENPIDYRILDVNPAFEKILGITRKRVIDKPATIAFGVETAPYL